MANRRDLSIHQISVEKINTPLARQYPKHALRWLTRSIENYGLLKPITVAKDTSSSGRGYNLVCGGARLEAFKQLERPCIPALLVDATESDCLLMGLVENIARRRRYTGELLDEVKRLMDGGYTRSQICLRLGFVKQFVSEISVLLKCPNGQLIEAARKDQISLWRAVDIARAPVDEIDGLLEAERARRPSQAKFFRSFRMSMVDILDSETLSTDRLSDPSVTITITKKEILTEFRKEQDKAEELARKRESVRTELSDIVADLEELLEDKTFASLLFNADLDIVPNAVLPFFEQESGAN